MNQDLARKKFQTILRTNPSSYEKLCKGMGWKPSTLGQYLVMWKTYPLLDEWRCWPSVDEKVTLGLRVKGIAAQEGIERSSETIRFYLIGTGQYDEYKERCAETDGIVRRMLYELNDITKKPKEYFELFKKFGYEDPFHDAHESSWAEGKAAEYIFAGGSQRQTHYTFSRLVTLFRRYECAIKKDRAVPLKKLGKRLGPKRSDLGSKAVLRVLVTVGLEALCRRGGRRRTQ